MNRNNVLAVTLLVVVCSAPGRVEGQFGDFLKPLEGLLKPLEGAIKPVENVFRPVGGVFGRVAQPINGKNGVVTVLIQVAIQTVTTVVPLNSSQIANITDRLNITFNQVLSLNVTNIINVVNGTSFPGGGNVVPRNITGVLPGNITGVLPGNITGVVPGNITTGGVYNLTDIIKINGTEVQNITQLVNFTRWG